MAVEIDKLEAAADMAQRITITSGGASAILAFLNANAGAFGLLIALIGVLVNVYYRRKAHKLLLQRPLYRGYYGAAKFSQKALHVERERLAAERARLEAERAAMERHR